MTITRRLQKKHRSLVMGDKAALAAAITRVEAFQKHIKTLAVSPEAIEALKKKPLVARLFELTGEL